VRSAALVLVALALTGCETTAEKSATLERQAKRERAEHPTLAQTGLSIAHASRDVKVVATSVVHSAEGTAAVVTLRNLTSKALRDIPIEITVRDAAGASVYTNSAPGLAASLVSAPLLTPHGELTWVDDQVRASAAAAAVSAKIGEAPATTTAAPRLSIEGAHLFEDPSNGPSVEGTLVNQSGVTQQELVVYAVARRAGTVLAAGRAVLALAPAGAATRFQIFFIGDPSGAQLALSAPPTTLG
jgi:hypothetical protein